LKFRLTVHELRHLTGELMDVRVYLFERCGDIAKKL
jgi:hypothetical protein